MTLKGQNFRILTLSSGKYKCIGMATNCTVTMTNNTEDASHKDIVGMAAAPVVTSQGWSVQVDSLSVADVGAMLTAIKSQTAFTLIWDETNTTNNQTGVGAAFARKGTAYLNDVTFNFNDRENSTKSLQFTGSGALETIGTPIYEAVAVDSFTKGQFVRLFLSSNNSNDPTKVIAGAKQLSLHVSLTLEDATTKDTDGSWVVQEPTALNYDISTTALVRSGDTISTAAGVAGGQSLDDIEDIYEAGTPVKWLIANVTGANQRVKGSTIVSGSVLLTQLTLNGPNRQSADYTAQLTGYGAYSV